MCAWNLDAGKQVMQNFKEETNKCLSQTGGWEDNIANNKRKHIEEETQDQSWRIPFSLDPMEYIRHRNPGFPS